MRTKNPSETRAPSPERTPCRQIALERVVPAPLEQALAHGQASEVYATDCVLACDRRYQLVAPSGKGKSTLLHILFGLRDDYSGCVRFDDTDIRTLTPDAWAALRERTLGMVFQDLRLLPQMTARENIALKWALGSDLPWSALEHMADQLGIAHVLDQPAATLSWGQQQRVAILRALSGKFRLLLLDEPFSHLDGAAARAARALIETRCRQLGAGFLLCTLHPDPDFSGSEMLHLGT